jgi:hypothetical protein
MGQPDEGTDGREGPLATPHTDGLCRCSEPLLHADDPELWCWRCQLPLDED